MRYIHKCDYTVYRSNSEKAEQRSDRRKGLISARQQRKQIKLLRILKKSQQECDG